MESSKGIFYSIGVDVGGTNTDAVILEYPTKRVVNWVKAATTKDFYTGILKAIQEVLTTQKEINEYNISCVMIGTTAFMNAVIQCSSELSSVNVIRLCGTASHSYPPFIDFPEGLKNAIKSDYFLIKGGYEFNKKEIQPLDENEIRNIANQLCQKAKEGNTHLSIAVCGIFSPICPDQEEKTEKILKEKFSQEGFENYSITLSHKIGQVGLLEREGATILNASVRNIAKRYINTLKKAIQDLNLVNCSENIYLTSNDGSLITCDEAIELPISTFNSGPTNSLRGASQLCQIKDALVLDIGGTSTDVAVLKNGFPRQASTYPEVAGVRTNFRMPDTISIGLGGGSLVEFKDDRCAIGPASVGYKLLKEAKSFGGKILTASDIALASGTVQIEGADPSRAGVDKAQIESAEKEILRKIEVLVDRMKTSADPLPLILVGGGSILVKETAKIEGVSEVIRPKNFSVANAVGAAVAQVSAIIETAVELDKQDRLEEIKKLKEATKEEVLKKGAIASTIDTIIDEVHLSYALTPLLRIICKAFGDLDLSKLASSPVKTQEASKIKEIKISNEEIEPFILDPNKVRYDEHLLELKPPKIEFNQQDNRKEWILSEQDAEYIAIGAGILGTGGGGSPYLGKLLLKTAIQKGAKVRVISPDTLREDEHAIGVGIYGTPYVIIERLLAGNDSSDATKKILEYYEKEGKKATCVSPCEIGGINSVMPIYVGGVLGLPVVDLDFMGRAFPKYQMITPCFYNKDCVPVCMNNEKGDSLLITKQEIPDNDFFKAEAFLRKQCIEFGCIAGIATPAYSKKDLDEIGIKFSVSRAWRLGREITQARKEKVNPLKVVEESENGKLLFVGKVIDAHRLTKDGFTSGTLTIEGLDTYKGKDMAINFQNENLVAMMWPEDRPDDKKCMGVVPDLICVVDTESYEPIPTEDFKYGLRVSILYLPASPLLKTPEALAVIGPKEFGYENLPEVAMEKEYAQPKSIFNDY